jgi:hypothetical protein
MKETGLINKCFLVNLFEVEGSCIKVCLTL